MSKQHPYDSGLKLLEDSELEIVSGGNVATDGNIKDFPPWLWPYIRPASLNLKQLVVKNVAIR